MDTVRTHTQVARSGQVSGRRDIRCKDESYMGEDDDASILYRLQLLLGQLIAYNRDSNYSTRHGSSPGSLALLFSFTWLLHYVRLGCNPIRQMRFNLTHGRIRPNCILVGSSRRN